MYKIIPGWRWMVRILLMSMLRHLLIYLAFYLKETPALLPLCHFRSFVDSYMIWQCFGFIKVLKIPTRRINGVVVR